MIKDRVGKSVGALIVSLSLVCTAGLSVFAVDEPQTSDVVPEASKSEVVQSKPAGSKPEESSGGETSKEDAYPYPTEDVDISFNILFSSNIFAKSIMETEDNIVLSNATFKVMSKDKKTSYGEFKLDDSHLKGLKNNEGYEGYKVTVPEWKEGSEYAIVFSNVPSFITDTKLVYSSWYGQSDEGKGDLEVAGITGTANCEVSTKRIVVVKATDMAGNRGTGATIELTQTDANGNVISDNTSKTDNRGMAVFEISEDTATLSARLCSDINGEKAFTPVQSDYDSITYPLVTVLTVSTELTDKEYKKDIEDIKDSVSLTVNAKFDSAENMDLFSHEPVSVSVLAEDGTTLGNLELGKDDPQKSVVMAKGTKCKIKVSCSNTYSYTVDSSSLTVNDDQSINITLKPQVFLHVYNEKAGVSSNVNFKLTGVNGEKTYKDVKSITFAVNSADGFDIINNDNSEVISVIIPEGASTTKLNLATGSIGVSLDNESKSDPANGDGSDTVPQTGDTIGIVASVLAIITLGCGAGWVYYKRKGVKYNENSNK